MTRRLQNPQSQAGLGVPVSWLWSGLFGMAALLFASSVEATHEADHRYLVMGYVHDGGGRPIPRSRVRVVRETTGLSYEAATDADGFYLLVIHLHDDDVGDALRVTAGRVTVRIEARFAPWDPKRHRGTRVDFRGTQAQERQELFADTLAAYLKR